MIEVSPILAKKINYYQCYAPSVEWLGLLVGKTQQENILLEDVLLADQTVSDSSTDLDDVNIHQVIFENADMLTDGSHIIGWVHTHPGMSAFLSGTDFDTINQAYHDYDPFISVVGGTTNIWGVKTGAEFEDEDELEELYPFVGVYGSHYPQHAQGWENIKTFEWKVWLSTVAFGFRMTAALNIAINPELMPSRRQKKALKRIFKKHVKVEVKPHVSTKTTTVYQTPKVQHL